MTKIIFGEETLMSAGLAKARAGDYFTALCLFSRCESYESYINRIMCLCLHHDIGYAGDLYMQFKRIFGSTHNCSADVELCMGSYSEGLLNFVESRTPERKLRRSENKISADLSLILEITDKDDYDETGDAPDFDFYGDSDLWAELDLEDGETTRFFDSDSVEYFDYLRASAELAYLKGERKKARVLTEKLLSLKTDHVPTVEAQLAVSLHNEDYTAAARFADKLSLCADATPAGIAGAIEAVNKSDGDRDTLKLLLTRAYAMADDMKYYDLEDYIEISSNRVKDAETAYKFARKLYADYKNITLDALKLCAVAFYNFGDMKTAKEAAILLTYAVPFDVYAEHLLKFFNTHTNEEPGFPLNVSHFYTRHYNVPLAVVVSAQSGLLEKAEEDKSFSLDEETLSDLSLMLYFCKAKLLAENTTSFLKTSGLVRMAVELGSVPDAEKFFRFAESQLASPITENTVTETLLEKMFSLGYSGTVLVNVGMYNYFFDASEMPECDDVFAQAMALLVSVTEVGKITFRRCLSIYKDLKKNIPLLNEIYNYRQIAYCCAAGSLAKFAKSKHGEAFDDEDKNLWLEWKKAETTEMHA